MAIWTVSKVVLIVLHASDSPFTGALGGVDFDLTPLSVLHVCHLRFAFEEMCVPQNTSLLWIPRIVSQLASPELHTLRVSLTVNNMEDLRYLNSECSIPELSLAYFDDMRILDWPRLESGLLSEQLGGLRNVILEGQGSRESLEEHIKHHCPKLDASGLLSLQVVKT